MNEPSAPVVRSGPGGTSVIALIGWQDDRGVARALLQALVEGRRARVFLAELRGSPGHDLTADVEVVAAIAWRTLTGALGEPVDPDGVEWYLRHGQFSTYDPAGPESLTRVDLTWHGDRWSRAGGWQAYELLDDAGARGALDGVDEVDAALEQVSGARPV